MTKAIRGRKRTGHEIDATMSSIPSSGDEPQNDATGSIPSLLAHTRAMRSLLAVARYGSTVRAAEAIHLSQPAVARAILELESAGGLALFSRSTRGMAPTPAGVRLASRIDTMFDHLAQGVSESVDVARKESGRSSNPADRFSAVVTPRQLRSLVAITEHGSETRAAIALGVSQPAVHAALRGLEDLAGVRLFYKLPVGTRLTPAGEALLRRVKLALAEVRAMEGDLAAWRGLIRGRVVVGVLPLSVIDFLPTAVAAMLERHPDIEIRIVDGTYESLVEQMLSAEIDAIAGALRADAPPDEISQLHLFDDDLVVVARKGHACLKRPLAHLSDLLQWPWVTPLPDTPADKLLNRVFRSQRLDPPARGLQASSPAMTLAFVMQTGRLAIASRGQARVDDHGGELRIVPFALPSTMRRIGIATRTVGEPSHDLRLFLDACKAAVTAGKLHENRDRR